MPTWPGKKEKPQDLDAGFMNEYAEKLQDAYRRGDLDLMDSLDNLLEQSLGFREKFMYRRNEIQANSIDSIIRHKSLFARVGAAHLPGSRGVIELLRKRFINWGRWRWLIKMGCRKTPSTAFMFRFSFRKICRRWVLVLMYPVNCTMWNRDYQNLDRRQFADMSNGSYYLVTRIRTHYCISEPAGKRST